MPSTATTKIWQTLNAVRGMLRSDGYALLVLRDAADAIGLDGVDMGPAIEESYRRIHGEPAGRILRAGTQSLIAAGRRERLDVLDQLIERTMSTREGLIWMRPAAADKVAELAGQPGRVLCAGDGTLRTALRIAVEAAETGRTSSVRFTAYDPLIVSIARAAAALLGCELEVDLGRHVMPSAGQGCDLVISAPPFGRQIDRTHEQGLSPQAMNLLRIQDERARLSSEAYGLAEVLAHAPSRALFIAPEGILFRTVGAEASVREALLASGRLRAVLAAPGGMMWTDSMIGASLLVIDGFGVFRGHVRFADLGSQRFADTGTRGRRMPRPDVAWTDAVEGPAADEAVDVSIDLINERGGLLTVARHLPAASEKALSAFLGKTKTVTLESLCEITRSMPLPRSEEGDFGGYEASPSDIGEIGFLEQPSRVVALDEVGFRAARRQMLRPGDVLLSVKGAIGVAGIVPDDVPTGDGQELWTAGQSLAILRLRPDSGMTPLALREFLVAEPVREILTTLAVGGAIPNIPVRMLRDFQIAIPTAAEIKTVEQNFDERRTIHARIAELKIEAEKHRGAAWPHAQMKGAA